MDNINVTVKSKNPAVEPKSLKELTAEVAEVKGTIVDINASVEQAEQDVERLNEAYNNSDDFIIGPDNKMKRKPKAYAPAEYSGLGEIYLDKNMQFLGREFEEFVSNPNVPHPGESIGDPDGIVYDRVRQAFLGYRNIEGSRMYTDTWDEQSDYTAASGYKYLCTSTDTAYKWQNGDLVETAAINGNVLTQAMLDFEHTIYHIQYDYDLNGRTIEVYEGSVLEFNGGSLKNGIIVGSNTKIEAGLAKIMDASITLDGTWGNNSFDVRWFGVESDNSEYDCTPILEKLSKLNIEIYFPSGIYYLSEFHYYNTKTDSFSIIGDTNNILLESTVFMPYNDSQYYIIKIGGGKTTLGETNKKGYNIKIKNIHFQTTSSFTPKQLTNTYGSTVEYAHSALVLDSVEGGEFKINGNQIHYTPLVSLCHIYECVFEDIVLYGNHGKSTLPVIQIINNNTKGITATIIKTLMCEAIVGTIITSTNASMVEELVIENIIFEDAPQWEEESITDVSTHGHITDFTSYEMVPIIAVDGFLYAQINNISLTQINKEWNNSLDSSNIKKARGFINFKSNGRIIISISSLSATSFAYITGTSNANYESILNISYIKSGSISNQSTTRYSLYLVGNKMNNNIFYSNLELNKEYKNRSLLDISRHTTIQNYGLPFAFVYDANNDYSLRVRESQYIINDLGIKFDKKADYIIMKFLVTSSYVGNFNMTFEYYLDDTLVQSSTIKTNITSGTKADMVALLDKSINYNNVKIKSNAGYIVFVYSIGAFTKECAPLSKTGSSRPTNVSVGYQFFDTSLSPKRPIWFNGTDWVDATGATV